jgi:hypothetical protein
VIRLGETVVGELRKRVAEGKRQQSIEMSPVLMMRLSTSPRRGVLQAVGEAQY